MKASKFRRSFTCGRFSSKKFSSIPAIDAPGKCPNLGRYTVAHLLIEKSNAQKPSFGSRSDSKRPKTPLRIDGKVQPRGHHKSSGRTYLQETPSCGKSSAVKTAQKRLESILARSRRLQVDHENLYSVSLLRKASADSSLIPTLVLSLVAALSFVLVVVFSGNLLLDDLASCRNNSSQEIHIQTMSWSRLPDGVAGELLPPGDVPGGRLSDLEREERENLPHWHPGARK